MIPNKLVQGHFGPMIINANDQFIGRSIELYGAWAQDDIELIKSIIDVQLSEKPCVTFYDVGANIGTHSVALGKHFGHRIHIRSFEAQRQIFYLLCGNVAINGLDNVICHQLAVADGKVDQIQVSMPDYNQINNFGGLELDTAFSSDNINMIKDKKETVHCVCLDDFDDSVDFVKLDVEGMEYQALMGAQTLISKNLPICFVEVLKSDKDLIKNFFSKFDYELYAYKSDDWIFVHKDSDVELDLPKVLI